MFTNFSKNALVPLLLRLILAAIFIYHGLDLVGVLPRADEEHGVVANFIHHGLDLKRGAEQEWGARWNPSPDAPPAAAQLAVAWGQLIGGIALGLGFLTRLAAVGIIVIMIGAIALVHWPHGFDIQKGGYEYNVAIITMCLCLVLGGAGPFAVDRFLGFRRKQP
jgi:uncharacterized membrane protein YphA (DoxX/SURF4 family)